MATSDARVMHVIPGLGTGGAEGMLAALVASRRDTSFEQTVVNLLSGGALADRIHAAGIPIIELGMKHPAGFGLAVLRLAGLIREKRPTAIQSWLYYGDLSAYWALRLSGQRAATRLYWGIRCADMDWSQYGFGLRLAVKACVRRSGQPDAVVANSYAGREAHRRLGYHPRAFPVIPNGIDTEKFRPDPAARAAIRTELGLAEDTPVVIHAGRVDPMKDHATLLEAAGRLPDLRFILAGAGTQALSVPPNVTALGLRRDMPSLYAAADIAVSTSISEGFPNVLAEAMASGVPVVATDVGDTRLIVRDTGVVVPPHNAAAIAAALRQLATEQGALRNQRSTAARERIRSEFSLEKAVSAFDALHLYMRVPDDPARHWRLRASSG